MFRMVELIYDQPAISFQSLYFEYGSQQALHRDPMFVVTDPPSHLLASWVALEDIAPDSGPLAYVPKSHRLPWFEFEPGHGGVRAEGPGREARGVRGMEARHDPGPSARGAARSRAGAATRSSGTPGCCTAARRIDDRDADAEELRRALLHRRRTTTSRSREHARARRRRLAARTSQHRHRDRTRSRPRTRQPAANVGRVAVTRAAASAGRRAGGAGRVRRGASSPRSPAAVVGATSGGSGPTTGTSSPARTGGNLGDLFRSHYQHWVTLPVLAYRLLWTVFGIRTLRAVPAAGDRLAPRPPRCCCAR